MPKFEPFAGLRYAPSVPMDEVIAPPYDVVGDEERSALAARHPANAIHVELPVDDPATGASRYQVASELLARWTREGIIREDGEPSLYTYKMTEHDGSSTTGVIGALECAAEDGDVLPHEQTIAKDMTDRLELLRECHVNTSPIWGLSLTTGLSKLYAPGGPPTAGATDDEGVVHELWVIEDNRTVDDVARAVASSPVVIADGHHRYATAGTYMAERRKLNSDSPGPYDFAMALVVELAEDQLSIGPIHRVLSGMPADLDLVAALGKWFDLELVGNLDLEAVDSVLEHKQLALAARGKLWRLSPNAAAMGREGSELDSTLAALALEDLGGRMAYSHDPNQVVRDLASGSADAALLLRPVSIAQISAWAHAGRRMPPKSTYFRPKPRTGMVFRPVEG